MFEWFYNFIHEECERKIEMLESINTDLMVDKLDFEFQLIELRNKYDELKKEVKHAQRGKSNKKGT